MSQQIDFVRQTSLDFTGDRQHTATVVVGYYRVFPRLRFLFRQAIVAGWEVCIWRIYSLSTSDLLHLLQITPTEQGLAWSDRRDSLDLSKAASCCYAQYLPCGRYVCNLRDGY